jgi:hypothetical protein
MIRPGSVRVPPIPLQEEQGYLDLILKYMSKIFFVGVHLMIAAYFEIFLGIAFAAALVLHEIRAVIATKFLIRYHC